MAFSKAPTQDTYSQHILPACYSLEIDPSSLITYIDASIGTGMQNMVPMLYQPTKEADAITYTTNRPALSGAVIDNGNTDSKKARGCYVWEKTSSTRYFYVVVGTKVYTSTDGSTWVLKHTLTTDATTPVGFCEFIDSSTNTKTLVLVDGVQGFTFATNAAGTEIVDAQFPTPHIPFPIYLDGYLFLAKPDTGDIYNSDLNNEESWTAGAFISSELYADDVKALAKVDNFLLAIGSQGCEYFYDAANATGSPLRRVDGASLPFGTFFPYTVAANKNQVTMVANMNDGEPAIVHIKGQEWKEITPDFMMPQFVAWIEDGTYLYTFNSIWGYYTRTHGDMQWVLNIGANEAAGASFVYSFKHDMWFMYTMTADASYGQGPFPVVRTAFSGRTPLTYAIGYANSKPFFAKWSEGADGALMYGTDQITNIGLTGPGGAGSLDMECVIVTPRLTFGTLNQKTMSRFGINGEQVPISVQDEDTERVKVTWYDFMQVGTTDGPLYLTLHGYNGTNWFSNPFITELGVFRKRRICCKFHPAGSGIVVYGFECNINKGVK